MALEWRLDECECVFEWMRKRTRAIHSWKITSLDLFVCVFYVFTSPCNPSSLYRLWTSRYVASRPFFLLHAVNNENKIYFYFRVFCACVSVSCVYVARRDRHKFSFLFSSSSHFVFVCRCLPSHGHRHLVDMCVWWNAIYFSFVVARVSFKFIYDSNAAMNFICFVIVKGHQTRSSSSSSNSDSEHAITGFFRNKYWSKWNRERINFAQIIHSEFNEKWNFRSADLNGMACVSELYCHSRSGGGRRGRKPHKLELSVLLRAQSYDETEKDVRSFATPLCGWFSVWIRYSQAGGGAGGVGGFANWQSEKYYFIRVDSTLFA